MSILFPKKWWALLGLGLSGMIFGIDYTIVFTALPTIQKSLTASISELQWIMAAFGLTYCTTLVLMGRLGDGLGHRLVLYSGMVIFGFASLGAGLSTVPWALIFFRLIQGFCGAALVPNGITLASMAFPASLALWIIIPALLLFGFSVGSGNGIGAPLALSQIPSGEDSGVITGALVTLGNVVGVLLLSIVGTLLHSFKTALLTGFHISIVVLFGVGLLFFITCLTSLKRSHSPQS